MQMEQVDHAHSLLNQPLIMQGDCRLWWEIWIMTTQMSFNSDQIQ